MKSLFSKTPAERLDYEFDCSDSLEADEDILTTSWSTSGTGLVIDGHTFAAGILKVWLKDGIDGVKYLVRCIYTTSNGRTMEDWFYLSVNSAA